MPVSAPATKSLPLPFAPPVQTATPRRSFTPPRPTPKREPLWLALYLPQLALQAEAHISDLPAIASEEHRGRFVVAALNAQAEKKGIAKGMPVNAAWALCPQLHVALRNIQAEYGELQKLAQKLYRYSASVSIQPPNMLLLEVRASLRLFGGLERLQHRILQTLQANGHACRHGVAPSVAAARLLAVAGEPEPVLESAALTSRLGRLPLSVLVHELPNLSPRLQKLGLRRLADLFRLPRAGLRRRFGAELILWMEQALGQRLEAPEKWTPPLHYRAEHDLDDPLASVDELFPIINNLLDDFCAWMRACSHHCNGFVLRFYHYRQPVTRLRLGLLRPSNQAPVMRQLLELRLHRERLAAPVIGLSLESSRLERAQAVNHAWWAEEQGADAQWQRTLESLQAKLGADAVHGLACMPDARPELAWRRERPGTYRKQGDVVPEGAARPIWLLPEPKHMNNREISNLRLESRSERIQSGWWDGQALSRDYFKAHYAGRYLWVYRCKQGWFWHGCYA